MMKQPIGPVRQAVARPAINALVKKSSSMVSTLMGMMMIPVRDDGRDDDHDHDDKALKTLRL